MIIFDYAEIRKYLKEPYPFESTDKSKAPINTPPLVAAIPNYLCNRKYGNSITCPVVCMKHAHEDSSQVCSNFGGFPQCNI